MSGRRPSRDPRLNRPGAQPSGEKATKDTVEDVVAVAQAPQDSHGQAWKDKMERRREARRQKRIRLAIQRRAQNSGQLRPVVAEPAEPKTPPPELEVVMEVPPRNQDKAKSGVEDKAARRKRQTAEISMTRESWCQKAQGEARRIREERTLRTFAKLAHMASWFEAMSEEVSRVLCTVRTIKKTAVDKLWEHRDLLQTWNCPAAILIQRFFVTLHCCYELRTKMPHSNADMRKVDVTDVHRVMRPFTVLFRSSCGLRDDDFHQFSCMECQISPNGSVMQWDLARAVTELFRMLPRDGKMEAAIERLTNYVWPTPHDRSLQLTLASDRELMKEASISSMEDILLVAQDSLKPGVSREEMTWNVVTTLKWGRVLTTEWVNRDDDNTSHPQATPPRHRASSPPPVPRPSAGGLPDRPRPDIMEVGVVHPQDRSVEHERVPGIPEYDPTYGMDYATYAGEYQPTALDGNTNHNQ